MKIVDKDPPTKEVQEMVDRMSAILAEGADDLIARMADDHRPDVRCFMAMALRDMGHAAATAFLFERRR